jgi:hypothetical protein
MRITGTTEIHVFFPNLEHSDQEVVYTGHGGRLQGQLRLGATLLAGDENFRDGGRFGTGLSCVIALHVILSL